VIELGPVYKTGARATLRSIYVRDPDGNLVEIANERRSEEALWQQVSKLPQVTDVNIGRGTVWIQLVAGTHHADHVEPRLHGAAHVTRRRGDVQ
jgi:catechol-2,3-dioxygenase